MIHSFIRGHILLDVPSMTLRRYRADQSPRRVHAHQCLNGLYSRALYFYKLPTASSQVSCATAHRSRRGFS